MGYNENCYKHLRESRKQARKLVSWITDSIYVDIETGEIINKEQLKTGEYIKIKSNTKYNTNDRYKSKTITTECERSKQRRFWE
jgi:hypothetical protein